MHWRISTAVRHYFILLFCIAYKWNSECNDIICCCIQRSIIVAYGSREAFFTKWTDAWKNRYKFKHLAIKQKWTYDNNILLNYIEKLPFKNREQTTTNKENNIDLLDNNNIKRLTSINKNKQKLSHFHLISLVVLLHTFFNAALGFRDKVSYFWVKLWSFGGEVKVAN